MSLLTSWYLKPTDENKGGMSEPIPTPPQIPFLGNVTAIEREVPVRSFQLLAQQYGDIFKLRLINREIVVVNSQELVNEVSDEKRFVKRVSGGLHQVRAASGDGLFTAQPEEPNWGIAHRLLMPAFSPLKVRDMFEDMADVTSQLLLKWERFGPHHSIEPAEDFTRLTLDAICLCAMGYRLNSFYRENMHPFAVAMGDFLAESGHRASRPALVQAVMTGTSAKYEQDRQVLFNLVTEILENRKKHPTEKEDILNVMLYGRDKETGQSLSDENIKYNLLTFLIAGHETTSGMLTFITYYLLKNPQTMRKLRDEIDTQIGDRAMAPNDLHKLPYLLAVMREALRLSPSAPMRATTAREDTTLGGGRWAVSAGQSIVVNTIVMHRDPRVWGPDASAFRPERHLDGAFERLPPNAWQPFGFGMRGCIGRPFAWQEVQLALVAILQRFDLALENPAYELELKQTLTIKPNHFRIRASLRQGRRGPLAPHASLAVKEERREERVRAQGGGQPMYVLYGSNTGASEAFAQRLASGAAAHGFRASIGTLDSATEHLPTDGPVLIVTASVEGQPTDNAAHFFAWLEHLGDAPLAGVRFGVFGCGNRDWAHTYQRIPTLVDEHLAARGAARLLPRGEGDASGGEFFDSFDRWEALAWETLVKEYGAKVAEGGDVGLTVEVVSEGTARASVLRQKDTALGTVVSNRVLTSPNVPEKRHIEFKLPEDMTYRAGDYLAILATNPERDVRRAISRFGFTPEQDVTITSAGPTSLPTGRPISVFTLLSGYVELSQPATQRDLRLLLASAKGSPAAAEISALSADYATAVLAKRLSVLDIVESLPALDLSFVSFLALLPAMRLRQYSISSSPLADPSVAALTISVITAPAVSGRAEPFLGVASTFLAGLRPGDRVQLSVRASGVDFGLPADPSTPLILIGAGSGLAPLRGFLQERAVQREAGREVGPSLLFFGCRAPADDFLYADAELGKWKELGVVDIRPAFSRAHGQSEGCKYVQDRVWHDRETILEYWDKGAKFFVCGSGKIAQGVRGRLLDIIKEKNEVDDARADEIFHKIAQGRFATDVFE